MTRWRLAPNLVLAFLFLALGLTAQTTRAFDLEDLPLEGPWDQDIPSPDSFFGMEVGTWHLPPERIQAFLEALAESSDRVEIETIGRTHEGRPQILLTIAHEDQIRNLDSVRSRHLSGSEDGPAVIWLGCSIHGNEPSGAHAALGLAWALAASRSPEVEALLRETVVLLDPMLNPDGLARFATWANMHRGRQPVAEPMHREHREGWPNGRTNHYWFDLNRDWLPAVHPETRHRLEVYRRWLPHVLVDLHEMGSSPDFFFQPGVRSRQHPLTPERNFELTRELTEWTAQAFDRAGVLYFTEETFDDFYYGKGSTYPDVQGSIGILFEQAAVRGHLRKVPTGTLDFRTAIQQQLLAALALVEGTHAKREDLIEYRRDFARETSKRSAESEVRGWLVGDDGDPTRLDDFASLMALHDVDVRRPGSDVEISGRNFSPSEALLIPAEQAQFRLLQSIFERRREFLDSTFYDVSAWTLPLAWGLPDRTLDKRELEKIGIGESYTALSADADCADLGAAIVATLEWNSLGAPAAMRELLEEGYFARVATRPFGSETRQFAPGTISVALEAQDRGTEDTRAFLSDLCVEHRLRMTGLGSALTSRGVDLGSPSVPFVSLPRPALVVGGQTDIYSAGSLWYRLDQTWGFALPLIEEGDLAEADFTRFTHLIFPSGAQADLPLQTVDRLRSWVDDGGILVAIGDAALWAQEAFYGQDEEVEDVAEPRASPSAEKPTPRRDWSDRDDVDAQKQIGGAIFAVDLDPSHPMGFGYPTRARSVMRRGSKVLETPTDAFARPGVYAPLPLLAGFASDENLVRLAGSPAVIARPRGKGVVIQLADDPSFRGFWRESDRLLSNTLFFGKLVAQN